MRTNAIFQRKEPRLEPQPCEIEKVIALTDDEFDRFGQNLLENYDFIQESAEDMGIREGVAHCLLVVDETSGDGILVNSEGSGYARYAAWFPGAKAFLRIQKQAENMVQTVPAPEQTISPALLAYGKKMEEVMNKVLAEAMEHHDQGIYTFSHGRAIDPELFADMLQERQEVTSVQTDGESIHITLSPESIEAYERSKLRVLSQEDVDIMCAKHTLWVYDAGGERADFSNCLLSGLDLQHRPLNGANFSGALLERTNLSSAGVCFCSFENTKFVDCQMVGISAEEVDFRNASFSGCQARMGHMAHSNFTGAQFENTDLWMADLRNCIAAMPPEISRPVPFQLPKANENMRRVYAYLHVQRGIDEEVLDEFLRKNLIYESAKYHNAVFVGMDKGGIPRHAHLRGSGTHSTYKGNTPGSLPEYSFHWVGTDPELYLFEAPIDLLSFISLHKKGWQAHSYAAACGVSDKVLWQMLRDYPYINNIGICFDSDKAGQRAARQIAEKLANLHIINRILVPEKKDWNEDLLHRKEESI